MRFRFKNPLSAPSVYIATHSAVEQQANPRMLAQRQKIAAPKATPRDRPCLPQGHCDLPHIIVMVNGEPLRA
jgi:hypothetical protein